VIAQSAQGLDTAWMTGIQFLEKFLGKQPIEGEHFIATCPANAHVHSAGLIKAEVKNVWNFTLHIRDHPN